MVKTSLWPLKSMFSVTTRTWHSPGTTSLAMVQSNVPLLGAFSAITLGRARTPTCTSTILTCWLPGSWFNWVQSPHLFQFMSRFFPMHHWVTR